MSKRPSTTKDARMRQLVTQEAAKIMAEEGVHDYLVAKRKAAERLGAPETRNLPTNREIQEALIDYQRLFQGEAQPALVRRLRQVALEAMDFFARFQPRLVGSVLHGTATEHSDVNLHLFADAPEEVALFLMDHHIPYQVIERRYRFGGDSYETSPVYRFVAGDTTVDAAVFSSKGLREAPRSRIDGQPMDRASIGVVRELLEGAPAR
jgi:hypothetical protein